MTGRIGDSIRRASLLVQASGFAQAWSDGTADKGGAYPRH